jgi:hypothetical protein
MAALKQKFVYCSPDITACFQQCVVRERTMVSVNRELVSKLRKSPGIEISIHYNPFVSTISTWNAIIVLFFMLVLLLPLQALACCDDPVISEVTPAAAVEKTLLPAQAPSAALELATATPAQAPGQSESTAHEDIKTNAAATLTAVTTAAYVKIANSGQPLDETADTWECIEDKSSKLTWEVKRNDGGIRDKDYSYSWLRGNDSEIKGVSNGGRCKGGVKCDTYSYIRAMNEQKLCGYSDWRLPTRKEMETLVDNNNTEKEATINKTYFPETVPSWYWTATENPRHDNFAWYVLFRNGIALNDLKERPKHIRLVRGNQTQ